MWIEKFQVEKSNKIAALYPTSKMIAVGLYSLSALIIATVKIFDMPLLLFPWFLIVLILVGASGVFKEFIVAMKKIGFIALVIFLAQTLLIPGGEVIYQLGFIKISTVGLEMGIRLSMSILTIAGAFIWLFQTTEHKEIARALEQNGVHHKVSYVFLSTMKMIEILTRNSKTIMNAQKARGVETEGNVFVRAKAFVPSMIPLVLGAIISSEDRVLTLESKGFDANCKKTHILSVKKTGNECKAIAVSIIVLVLAVVIRGVAWVL